VTCSSARGRSRKGRTGKLSRLGNADLSVRAPWIYPDLANPSRAGRDVDPCRPPRAQGAGEPPAPPPGGKAGESDWDAVLLLAGKQIGASGEPNTECRGRARGDVLRGDRDGRLPKRRADSENPRPSRRKQDLRLLGPEGPSAPSPPSAPESAHRGTLQPDSGAGSRRHREPARTGALAILCRHRPTCSDFMQREPVSVLGAVLRRSLATGRDTPTGQHRGGVARAGRGPWRVRHDTLRNPRHPLGGPHDAARAGREGRSKGRRNGEGLGVGEAPARCRVHAATRRAVARVGRARRDSPCLTGSVVRLRSARRPRAGCGERGRGSSGEARSLGGGGAPSPRDGPAPARHDCDAPRSCGRGAGSARTRSAKRDTDRRAFALPDVRRLRLALHTRRGPAQRRSQVFVPILGALQGVQPDGQEANSAPSARLTPCSPIAKGTPCVLHLPRFGSHPPPPGAHLVERVPARLIHPEKVARPAGRAAFPG